jgi:energy-coupling factor transporter ATP-binding protein EcfA2
MTDRNQIFDPKHPGDYQGDDRVITSDEMREELSKRQASRPYTVLKTGIGHLDRVLNDVEGGELILVTGKTEAGKTTLLKTITKNLYEQGIETLWIPFEAGGAKFIRGFGDDIKFNIPRQLKPGSWKWVTERMKEAVAKYDAKAVFLDHLHRLANMMQLENPAIQLGAIVSALVTAIEEMNVALFMVVLMQKVQHNIPESEDVRDSGVIVYECDTMLGLYRGDKAVSGSTESRIRVIHNRREGVTHGPATGEHIRVRLEGQYLVDDLEDEGPRKVPAFGGEY